MPSLININSVKYCAFCKYWWDPTCKFIQPNVKLQWYFEPMGRCRCIKKGIDTSGNQTCQYYKCKIDW